MSHWLSYIAAFAVLLGAVFSLLGALGVWRLPDAYTRMHSASKAGALGAMLTLVGVLAATGGENWLAIGLAISVLAITAPLAAHAISRAGYLAGVRPQVGPLGDQMETSMSHPMDGTEEKHGQSRRNQR